MYRCRKECLSVLKLTEKATPREIKTSYRRLALQYHPDKCSGNDVMFKRINEAYQFLSKTGRYEDARCSSPDEAIDAMVVDVTKEFVHGYNKTEDTVVDTLFDVWLDKMNDTMEDIKKQMRSRTPKKPEVSKEIVPIRVPVTFAEIFTGKVKKVCTNIPYTFLLPLYVPKNGGVICIDVPRAACKHMCLEVSLSITDIPQNVSLHENGYDVFVSVPITKEEFFYGINRSLTIPDVVNNLLIVHTFLHPPLQSMDIAEYDSDTKIKSVLENATMTFEDMGLPLECESNEIKYGCMYIQFHMDTSPETKM